ncbi:hypothetical protein [Nitrobacter sp.]|uniref:hypothetical protein n=1 Tax=Nitrobacter sp. TaxID=29420 RepID=UPI0029CAACC2|nr:hypothetical protein [Nitrobacter sp.]
MSKLLDLLPSWVPIAAVGILLAVLAGGALALRQSWKAEATAAADLAKALDDNKSLEKTLRDREAFQDEVRKGFQDLASKVGDLKSINTTFQRQVRSHADSSEPLTDSDRADLGLLFPGSGGDKGGAGTIRGSGSSR